MDTNKMFETAIRNKVRFPFKGVISVEDMWDLNLMSLDSVFKTLNSQLKQVKEESLLNVKTKQDEILDLQIEIVKYIVKVKQEEDLLRLQANEKREKKQKLMGILSEKQDSELHNKTVDEIKAMLEELSK